MKKWKAEIELFWDASHVESVEVKANTERKARIFAEEAMKKKYKTDMVNILRINEIKED